MSISRQACLSMERIQNDTLTYFKVYWLSIYYVKSGLCLYLLSKR